MLTQALDKVAISLSALCAIHCLLMPVVIAIVPSLIALPFADERFHLVLLLFVLPTSVIALFMGCRKHRRWNVVGWGSAGIVVLIGTVMAGHEVLGETLEKLATMLGVSLVVVGHTLNFRQCRSSDCPH